MPGSERETLNICAADNDGDCEHSLCPQNRDGEPHKSGRSCPLEWVRHLSPNQKDHAIAPIDAGAGGAVDHAQARIVAEQLAAIEGHGNGSRNLARAYLALAASHAELERDYEHEAARADALQLSVAVQKLDERTRRGRASSEGSGEAVADAYLPIDDAGVCYWPQVRATEHDATLAMTHIPGYDGFFFALRPLYQHPARRTETYPHDCGCETCPDHAHPAPAPGGVTDAMVEAAAQVLNRVTPHVKRAVIIEALTAALATRDRRTA